MIRHVVIHQTETGLLYRQGRFERTLEPGGHWLRGPGRSVTHVDTRRRLLVVTGQEVLTSDTVQVRASAVAAYRVTGNGAGKEGGGSQRSRKAWERLTPL